MAFSTSTSLAHAWRFDDITPSVVAQQFACSAAEAKRRLADLRGQLADPQRARQLVCSLPVPALAVLSLLADHDGMLAEDELSALARESFGLSRDEIVAGISVLLRHVLVVSLRGSWQGTEFALIEPAVQPVLDHVVDLDIPVLPAGDLVPRADHDGGRTLVAACMAAGQVEVKLTQAGALHRSSLKRLAKQLGATEQALDVLEAALATGLACGLLACNDELVLRPQIGRLRDVARGSYAHDPALSVLGAHLASAGPQPRAAVARWYDRLPLDLRRLHDVEELARLPGFCIGTVGSVDAIGPAPHAGAAAASITPSFEVFLPPESRLDDLVNVLECSELARIDRVIVARITKASISRAVAAGRDGEGLLAALSAACRTPLPQNVEIAIRDWAGGLTFATTAVGRIVVVPAADEARVRGALDAFEPRVAAPGVLVLPPESSPRAVANALAKIGVHERAIAATGARSHDDEARERRPSDRSEHRRTDPSWGRAPGAPRDDESRMQRRSSPPSTSPVKPPTIGGDPALRARLAAYRRGDEAERKLVPVVAPRAPRQAGPGRPDGDDDALLAVSTRIVARLEQWEHDRGCRLSDDELNAALVVLDSVGDHDRRFVLAAADAKQLETRILEVLARGGLASVLAKHRDVIAPLLPQLTDMLEAVGIENVSSPPVTLRRGPAVEWYRDGILARLQAAARTRSTLMLDVGTRIARVAVTRVLPKGSIWMILGDDLDAELQSVALPLAAIRAVADPPPEGSRPSRWQPADGERIPAGHVPCPCGSGRRYRNCCRSAN